MVTTFQCGLLPSSSIRGAETRRAYRCFAFAPENIQERVVPIEAVDVLQVDFVLDNSNPQQIQHEAKQVAGRVRNVAEPERGNLRIVFCMNTERKACNG